MANTLFNHARTYPAIWFGIWSGPDTYLPSNSDRPGETWIMPHYFGLQPWPVQILFPHSETLNSTLWLMGIEATAKGISVYPRLPSDCWSWSSPGLTIRYDKDRIHGSISGVGPELISLELKVPPDWQGGGAEIEEGGRKRKADNIDGSVRLRVWVAAGTTTEFSVTKV